MVEFIRLSSHDRQRRCVSLPWSSHFGASCNALKHKWQQSKWLLRSQILLLVLSLLLVLVALLPIP